MFSKILRARNMEPLWNELRAKWTVVFLIFYPFNQWVWSSKTTNVAHRVATVKVSNERCKTAPVHSGAPSMFGFSYIRLCRVFCFLETCLQMAVAFQIFRKTLKRFDCLIQVWSVLFQEIESFNSKPNHGRAAFWGHKCCWYWAVYFKSETQ